MNYESREDWLARGRKLFGEDMYKWRFKCPACGRTQSAEDFRRFKGKGATPSDAYQDCLGRWDHSLGCDWAAYGLLRGPDFVRVGEDQETPIFPFDEPKAVTYEPYEPPPRKTALELWGRR